MKSESLSERAKVIFNGTINVTTAGKRQLGAELGPQDFKTAYCKDKIEIWAKELNVLSGFAVSQPHAAFSAFSKGFKSKFTYFFRTIPEIADMLEPIECFLENKLVPALFGSESPLENKKRQIIGLPVSKGGLGFGALKEEARFQNENSKIFSKPHKQAIIDQLSDTTLDYSGGKKNSNSETRKREKIRRSSFTIIYHRRKKEVETKHRQGS